MAAPSEAVAAAARTVCASISSLRVAGVPAVHLGVLTANTGARAFYNRLGFAQLRSAPPVTYLGRDTSSLY